MKIVRDSKIKAICYPNEKDMHRIAPSGAPWRTLFHGAVRESLASANSVAQIGIQDTRAWERPMRYVVDDNQGNVGVVEFQADTAIAAISARLPGRVFELSRAIGLAPTELQNSLSLLCTLPLLQEGFGVSEIFWTVGECIGGPEDWGDACLYGAELFKRELQSDSKWEETALEYYDLKPDVAHLAAALAARTVVSVPMLHLTEYELTCLVPNGAKHERAALGLLAADGLFEFALP